MTILISSFFLLYMWCGMNDVCCVVVCCCYEIRRLHHIYTYSFVFCACQLCVCVPRQTSVAFGFTARPRTTKWWCLGSDESRFGGTVNSKAAAASIVPNSQYTSYSTMSRLLAFDMKKLITININSRFDCRGPKQQQERQRGPSEKRINSYQQEEVSVLLSFSLLENADII